MGAPADSTAPWIARLEKVTVVFGPTRALSDLSLEFARGEIHALLGENGAGKSTALRVLAGMVPPHSGTCQMAPKTRVAWVPQEIELPQDLAICDWLFLGREPTHLGFLRQRDMRVATEQALALFSLPLSPLTPIAHLSPAACKIVQFLRALHDAPHLLLLDEPTAVLSEAHCHVLFSIVRELRARGAAVVYVSHRLPEVLANADRISVLRDGTLVWSGRREATDEPGLLSLMAGPLTEERPQPASRSTDVALEVTGLHCGRVENFSLTVHRGEIVGLAGLTGSGRSSILECLAGRLPRQAGSIRTQGSVALVPEDRRRKGLAFDLSVRENVFLPARSWWIAPSRERREARFWLTRLQIRAPGSDTPVRFLSGGNQQKLLFARALRSQPDVLLADEPTAGVDVATKAAIHNILQERAGQGAAIVISSSDVSELLRLCHRIVALRAGHKVAEAPTDSVHEEQVVGWITGAQGGVHSP